MSLPIFKETDLRAFRAKMYETKYQLPEIEQFNLPVAQESMAGAEDISFDLHVTRGIAHFAGANETNVPLVQESTIRTVLPQQYMILGYDLTIAETMASTKSGKLPEINERRMKAVRQGIADASNVLGLRGSAAGAILGNMTPPKSGHEGLYNHSKALSVALSSPGAWTAATPAEKIFKDLMGLLNAVKQNSKSAENPNILVLPALQMDLAELNFFANTSMSAIEKLRMIRPDVRMFRSDTLGTAGAGNGTRVVAMDSSQVERIMAAPFQVLDPQSVGYKIVFPAFAMSGGVLLPYPKSLAYMDGV
jgi:hypothetical protein